MQYECSVCGHIYDEDAEGTPWSVLADEWECPVCSADKSYFEAKGEAATPVDASAGAPAEVSPALDTYLSEWKRPSDELEHHFAGIQHMAVTGESIIEPMRTRKPAVSWDDVLVMGAQLATLPRRRRHRN